MEPVYADGDWLLVRPLKGACTVSPGEVVVARRGQRLVTHRVVALRDGMVTTRGDACRSIDPPLPVGSLLGRVVGARPRSTYFPGYRLIKRLLRGLTQD